MHFLFLVEVWNRSGCQFFFQDGNLLEHQKCLTPSVDGLQKQRNYLACTAPGGGGGCSQAPLLTPVRFSFGMLVGSGRGPEALASQRLSLLRDRKDRTTEYGGELSHRFERVPTKCLGGA